MCVSTYSTYKIQDTDVSVNMEDYYAHLNLNIAMQYLIQQTADQ
jgi:hypothetical protein